MSGLLSVVTREIKDLLAPVSAAAQTAEALEKLLDAIGVVGGADPALPNALAAVAAFAKQCEDLDAQSDPSFESIASLLNQNPPGVSSLRRAGQRIPRIAHIRPTGIPSAGIGVTLRACEADRPVPE